jgi:capsular polysaccharide export protein
MILIVIDSLERYYFAKRLVNAVRHEYEFAFLTSEPVAHLGLLLNGYRSVYVSRLSISRRHCCAGCGSSNA